MKVEMKKFQNLIENKLRRKNNLTYKDMLRLFPMNKVVDGSAYFVKIPMSFKENLIKNNPRLSKFYEMQMKKI